MAAMKAAMQKELGVEFGGRPASSLDAHQLHMEHLIREALQGDCLSLSCLQADLSSLCNANCVTGLIIGGVDGGFGDIGLGDGGFGDIPPEDGPVSENPGHHDPSGGPKKCLTGGNSFSAGTRVLLASGAKVPISHLKPGDKVLATSTKTGTTQPEAVTAVLVHHDNNLYNLTVKTSRGTAVIHTTASHLFWDPYPHYGWIPANHLKPGMHLKTPDGQLAVVVGGSVPAVHDGWMWDLTVPGNNDHDFYVVIGTRPGFAPVSVYEAVLVHNDDSPVGTVFRSGSYRFQIYSNDHGPAHGHLLGPGIGGDGIQIGQNGKPLNPNVKLTPAQQNVIDENLGTIRNAIGKYMAWYRSNCG
jgi:hypothetical protein